MHPFALINPCHDFRNVQTRLHVKICERCVRVIKASRIFLFKLVHHIFYDTFRGEKLVRSLRRNIIEDVPLMIRLEIVCKFRALFNKLLNGIINYNFPNGWTIGKPILSFL